MKLTTIITSFIAVLFTSFGVFSQVSKSDATGETLNPGIAIRNFTFTSGEFGGCASLTEVEVDLTLTLTNNSDCSSGAFGAHNDIAVSLESPNGTVVHLAQDFSGILLGSPPLEITYQDSGFPVTFQETTMYDDDATLLADDQTFFGAGTFKPHNALSAFDGEDPSGTWILRVADGRDQAGFGDFTCYVNSTVRVTCGAACADPDEPTVTSSPASLCDGDAAVLNISGALNDATDWHVYTGSCGGTEIGTTNGSTFNIPSVTGSTQYFVRGEGGCVTPGTCGTTTINPTPLEDASFSYILPEFCQTDSDGTPTITGVAGGTFSSAPAGLSLNPTTGVVDVSASSVGTYTITYTTGGTCPNASNVSLGIYPADDASFSYSASSYCLNDVDPTPIITGAIGGSFLVSPSGLAFNASTGQIDVSASTPGVYTVTYLTAGTFATTGTCANFSNVNVTIRITDDASFSYSAGSYCVSDSDPTPTVTGLSGGSFSSAAGLSLNGSSGLIDLSASTAGFYTVTYTTAGPCPNTSNVNITVNALDDASFSYSAAAFCVSGSDPTPTITGVAGGSFSSTPGLSLNPGSGTIDVSTSTPGTYTVTYTTVGTCPNMSNVNITINPLDDATFSYSAGSYCVNDADPTPTVTGLLGGTFSSLTAGLIINGGSGAIDLSTSVPGTYNVLYVTNGTCPENSVQSVTVTGLDDASFSYSSGTFCVSGADATPTITGIVGGTFSSTAGLSINSATGVIDVSTSTPGNYTIVYTTAGLCSNSSNVSVTIAGNSSGTDVQVACDTYTWIDGMTYTSSTNTPTFVIPNAAGCDSTVTLNLTINNSTTGTDVQIACDSYTWIDGMTYTASTNTPTFVIPNAIGCDSTVTLDLTINNATNGTDVQTACASYTWIDGMTYTATTNTPTFVIPNTVGCDSTVTLDLTILTEVTSMVAEEACETFVWTQNGMTYTTSGMYNDTIFGGSAEGCDSIIVLDLTINIPTTGTDVQVACDSYTWINGVTYTTSNNTATETLVNNAGCDSIVTLNLTINNSITTIEEVFVCDETYTWSVNGMTYTTSGTYSELLTASNGCDSTVVLELTIGGGIDLTVTSVDETLIAVQFVALYQWIDCDNGNAPIEGANGQSFTPEVTGNYAVIIEDNGCVDTSDCYAVNVSNLDELNEIFVTIYPNPTSTGLFNIQSENVISKIEVIDLLGRIQVVSKSPLNGVIDVSMLSKGKYIAKITTIRGVVTEEIVIQ